MPERCPKCKSEDRKVRRNIRCSGRRPHAFFNDYGEPLAVCGRCCGSGYMECSASWHEQTGEGEE